MNTKKSAVLTAAVSALLLTGCPENTSGSKTTTTTETAPAGSGTVAKHSCKGQNACKGQGGCGSGDKGCAGKNSCKGNGGCASDMGGGKK